MAFRKTINLLPEVFQTDRNEKFLNATLDQLVTPASQTKINGFIGRTFAPSRQTGDAYVQEPTPSRQNYQLEPGVVFRNTNNSTNTATREVEFLTNYIDMINRVGFYGGLSNDHDRLYQNEYYNWSSFFDFDKFVNFSQYYWLPGGPTAVEVFSSEVDTEVDFDVTRSTDETAYFLSGSGAVNNPTITLARGGNYTFNVNQQDVPFWIQTEPGTSGVQAIQSNVSTRDILGVENNGTDVGTVTLNVPESDAQNFWITMTRLASVDLASRHTFAELNYQTWTTWIAQNPDGIDGITDLNTINGATLVFYNDDLVESESNWQSDAMFDSAGFDTEVVDGEVFVEEGDRYDIWQLVVGGDDIMRLSRLQDIPQENKVLVLSGNEFGNRELWKNASQKLEAVPVITAPLTTLYYQDGTDAGRFGVIRLVEVDEVPAINVAEDILGKAEYISPNDVVFSNGLKVLFNSDVTPTAFAGNEFYVEGVGEGIQLVPVDELVVPEPFTETSEEEYDSEPYDTTGYAASTDSPINQEYFVSNRASIDRNAWARTNRWFHIDVIEATAAYTGVSTVIDQAARANRPIIEFDASIQLWNYGTVFKSVVDVFDTAETDALSNVQGAASYTVDGVPLLAGDRVIWSADTDSRVSSKIYQVEFIDLEGDQETEINLVEVDTIEAGDIIVVDRGVVNQGLVFHWTGTAWATSQQKTSSNQEPFFDVYDFDGNSFGDGDVYLGSAFTGSKLFSYQQQPSGLADPVLGFVLNYRNFENVGDIIFENNFKRDKFTYSVGENVVTKSIGDGLVHINTDRAAWTVHNDWTKVNNLSRQRQIVEYNVAEDTSNNEFEIGTQPSAEVNRINLQVFKNGNILVRDTDYTVYNRGERWFVGLLTAAAIDDQVVVRVYSEDTSNLGYYEVPSNLEFNADNKEFTTLTLGQIRNHVAVAANSIVTFTGQSPGRGNIRDIGEFKTYPGLILQHSAGVHLGAFMLSGENVNFADNTTHVHSSNYIDAVSYAQREYTKFKQKFLDAISSMNLDSTNIPGSVDVVLQELAVGKTSEWPFFYSDMVAWSDDRTTFNYTVASPDIKDYDYTGVFDPNTSSNRSVLVYLNDVQQILGRDYTFDPVSPVVIFTDNVTLAVDDAVRIVDYTNTNGSFMPPTPTKMGMWPRFTPEKVADETFQSSQMIIQGHDGSTFVAFGDYRDDMLLELEKRVYNNCKVDYDSTKFDWDDFVPGKWRETRWTRDEINTILSGWFTSWATLARIDWSVQTGYDITNKFTWNYSEFGDKDDGELLPGHWKGIFRWFYDTERPHTHPWEMLGLSEKPDWWDDRYGVAPYTAGNNVLWENLRDGKLFSDAVGANYTVVSGRQRPDLLDVIPVDSWGDLRDPLDVVVGSYSSTFTEKPWTFGDVAPVESAWRRSSDYVFDMQKLAALVQPAAYFGVMFDTADIQRNTDLDQILYVPTRRRLTSDDLVLHATTQADGTVNLVPGISQYISDWARHKNVGLDNIQTTLNELELGLVWRVGGYTAKNYLKILAEQVSPTSTNKGVFIPDEDFDVQLMKSNPLASIAYSGVIITVTSRGWTVSGYDFKNPFFTVLPSVENARRYEVTAGQGVAGTVYRDNTGRATRVPYGTTFTNRQAVFDFIVSYQRWLEAQGFLFDQVLSDDAIPQDWIMSGREFLFWTTQGWKVGSSITLNPTPEKIRFNRFSVVADTLSNESAQYRVLNQNFEPIRYNRLDVKRIDNQLEVTVDPRAGSIYLLEVNPVRYEHAVVFNNTTVFNDVLFQPELGSRQFRMKVLGTKTANWDGTLQAPGYILAQPVTREWQPGLDYKRGDFVNHKKKTWVAVRDQDASQIFDQTFWKAADNIKTGLLPNLTTSSAAFKGFYDRDVANLELEQDRFGKGLIGYKPRSWLENLELDDVSQVKFYQGMIKQKGTAGVIDKLIRAQLDNTSSEISWFEEWGFRVGEYGAFAANQIIEVTLSEADVQSNPELIEFINNNEARPTGHISYNQNDLWKTPNNYDKNLWNTRSVVTDLSRDVTYAGFPRLDNVDATVFDMENISELNSQIDTLGVGSTVWTAKNLASVWDIFRITESFTGVVSASGLLDQEVLVRTDRNHNLTAGDAVLVKDTTEDLDSFWVVKRVVSNVEFIVTLDEPQLDEPELNGTLFTLRSVKFSDYADIASFTPRMGWEDGEFIWIEDTGDGNWQVLEKSSPWTTADSLAFTNQSADEAFGTTLAVSENALWGAVGVPNSAKMVVFWENANGNLVENSVHAPASVTGMGNFGYSVDVGNTEIVVTGAPTSDAGRGLVMLHARDDYGSWVPRQVIYLDTLAADAALGTAVSISDDERWVYLGAPGSNEVLVFGRADPATRNTNITAGDDSTTAITLDWTPPTIWDIHITDSTARMLVPFADYTLAGNVITFTAPLASGLTYVTREQPTWRYVATITSDDVAAGDQFGSSISTTADGRYVMVGAPGKDSGAGAAYQFERREVKYWMNGVADTVTLPTAPGAVYRVTVDGVEQVLTDNLEVGPGDSSLNYYTLTGTTLVLKWTPSAGSELVVEINDFSQVQKLAATTASDEDLLATSVDVDATATWIVAGAPGKDSANANTGAAYVWASTAGRYYYVKSAADAGVSVGHGIRVNDVQVTFTGTDTSAVAADIRAANIPGIDATTTNGVLTITGTAGTTFTVAPNTGTAWSDLGFAPWTLTQTLVHPSEFENENFGLDVSIDRAARTLAVSSDVASTIKPVLFDVDEDGNVDMTFDANSTRFLDRERQSGAVYIYNLLAPAAETSANPAQYAFVQQLVSTETTEFDSFGSAIDIRDGKILVGAPGQDRVANNAGNIYQFTNPGTAAGWTAVHNQEPKVDVELFNKAFLYNRRLNEIDQYLDWIDPWKGKVSGFAQQELSWTTERDPASYNINNSNQRTTNPLVPWGARQVGQLWWDISTVRYVEYEQGDLEHRTTYWGRQFPGSSIDVYEWVESDVVPSLYTGPGTAKHVDDSSYVEREVYNPVTDTTEVKYYFWARDLEVLPAGGARRRSSTEVARLIDNPVGSGLFHLAFVQPSAMLAYNIAELPEADNTILHVNYDVIPNDNVLHSEYQLLGQGDEQVEEAEKLFNKLVDSLAGSTEDGLAVPALDLSPAERYGVLYRPRQTMFVDRSEALHILVDFCNEVFAQYQIANQFDLTTLRDAEEIPSAIDNAYDETVATFTELSYLDITSYATGYRVLVEEDENNEGYWTIYSKLADNTWQLTRIQSYDTARYWTLDTWFAPGFDANTTVNYVVETRADLQTLTTAVDGELARVNTNDTGSFSIFQLGAGTWTEVIVENATVRLLDTLWDISLENVGYDNSAYDTGRYDRAPTVEVRRIVTALKNDIFIEGIRGEWNRLWFTLMEYILTEQPYADWMIKTSFIKIRQRLRGLDQFPSFQRDNQDFIRDYVTEVKPYRTNIREYLLEYNKQDPWGGDPTDFDLHSYFDEDLGYYRKPSGSLDGDAALQQSGVNVPWFENHKYQLGSILIIDAGFGYTEDPIITISGGGGTGATATARTNGNSIAEVVVTNPGSGYTSAPTITIDGGGAGSGLVLYPQLSNGLVRELHTTLKFDRTTYSSAIQEWTATTSYTAGDVVSYQGLPYLVEADFTTGATFAVTNLTLLSEASLSETYVSDGATAVYNLPTSSVLDVTLFTADSVGVSVINAASGVDQVLQLDLDYTVNIYDGETAGNITFLTTVPTNGETITVTVALGFDLLQTTADRIAAFYNPTVDMVGKDLAQLQTGTDYRGVKVQGLGYSAIDTLDAIIESEYTNTNLGLASSDINIAGGEFVDTYNSHAPEELVPGIIFDSLNLKVYTQMTQDQEFDGNGPVVNSTTLVGDGSTVVFSYAEPGVAFESQSVYIWSGTDALYEGADYVLDRFNGNVTFTATPADGAAFYVQSWSIAGEKPTFEDVFTGDGLVNVFDLDVEISSATQALALVDNEVVAATTSDTGNDTTRVTLASTPAVGAHVHIVTYDRPVTRNAATTLRSDTFTSDGLNRVFALTTPMQYRQPFAGQAVVEVNGSRLRPDVVSRYVGDGSTAIYSVPSTSAVSQAAIADADIVVSIVKPAHLDEDNPVTNLEAGTHYTVQPFDGSSIRTITFTGANVPDAGDIVFVGITTAADYTVSTDGATLTLDGSVAIAPGDIIRVTHWTNHDPALVFTKVFEGTGDTASRTYPMDRELTTASYLWVSLDGTKLHPGVDYSVSGENVVLSNALALNGSSIIVVTSFTENTVNPATGYQAFKDMLGNWTYSRIAEDSLTTLAAELNIEDTEISVVDASVLTEPTLSEPGVIWINKERIAYWTRNTVTNTLSNIRRATAGTGAATSYAAGSEVLDTAGNTVPGDNVHTQVWYTAGVGTASDGRGLANATTVQAEYLKAKPTVFLG